MSVADHDTLTLLHDKADFYGDLKPDVAKLMDFIAVNNRDEFDSAVTTLSVVWH